MPRNDPKYTILLSKNFTGPGQPFDWYQFASPHTTLADALRIWRYVAKSGDRRGGVVLACQFGHRQAPTPLFRLDPVLGWVDLSSEY